MKDIEIKNYIFGKKCTLFARLDEIRIKRKGREENFREDFCIVLNDLFTELNLSEKISRESEYTVIEGRIDSLFGNFVLEYKAPGVLKDTNVKNVSWIEQVKRQITGLRNKTGIEYKKIEGAIFDGYYVIYVNKKEDKWDISNPQKITEESYALFLFRLISVNMKGKALTVENLVQDFSHDSELAKDTQLVFSHALKANRENNKATLLYEQWKVLYQEVCGYDFEVQDEKFTYSIFSIQTYFALLIKVLSLNVLRYMNSTSKDVAFETGDMETLRKNLFELEEGTTYHKLGITNFLEGDFFSWYLYLWNEDIYKVLSAMVEKFRYYDYAAIILKDEMAKDLLKNLYYKLMPIELRRKLGEFYTPDWLADFLLDNLQPDIGKNNTFLDPTCGSGTFIVLLIKKFIDAYREEMDSKELLKMVIRNVRGYDLNPLAVICARANYIIALGNLLVYLEKPVEIPIYLCDAMLTILSGDQNQTERLVIPTKAARFELPVKIVEEQYVNRFLDMVHDDVKRHMDVRTFAIRLERDLEKAPFQLVENDYQTLLGFYNEMLELNERGLDGIWTNVIKNVFAPIFQDKVDYVVGNPPWIDWQNLPADYRESIQKYWHEYKVFDHVGQKAQLGSAHDDISVLMTYVIMDNFLKENGQLAFVINQNLLQASGGGDGFRKFQIKGEIPVSVRAVNDFVEVEPFKSLGVSNKTATIVLKKNEKNVYPIAYMKWHKRGRKVIDANLSKEEIISERLMCEKLYASPIDLYNSPWMIASERDRDIFCRMQYKGEMGTAFYRARKGVDTSANAIFWVREKGLVSYDHKLIFVDNSPENSRKKIMKVSDWLIDRDLLYPLVRGRDVHRWKYDTELSIILPYDKTGAVIDKNKLMLDYPTTYDYFYNSEHKFVSILEGRATYKKFIMRQNKNAPVYSLYNIGAYTFSPYKAIWKALAGKVEAVVISQSDGRIVIPDHNLLIIPLEDEDEAFYLVGILNSEIVTKFVKAYVAWFFSAHILEKIKIPRFCKEEMLHNDIAILSREAHSLVQGEELCQVEKRLNEKVNELLLK